MKKGPRMKHPRHPQRGLGLRLCAITGAVALGVAGIGVGEPGAGLGPAVATAAPPFPQTPQHPDYANVWANPLVRPEEAAARGILSVELHAIDARPRLGEPLYGTITVRNLSQRTIKDVQLTPRRAGAVPTVGAARWALAQDVEAYPVRGETMALGDIPAGGAHTVTLNLDPQGPLQFNALGTYPLLFLAESAAPTPVVSTERTLLRVEAPEEGTGTPGARAEATGTNPDATSENTVNSRAGITMLYPLSEPTNVVPGEVGDAPNPPTLILRDDSLGASIRPGGRLYQLLDNYEHAVNASPAVGVSTCLALDPALLDVLQRMSRGYQLGESRTDLEAEPRRLRDSWRSPMKPPSTQPGPSAKEAGQWLERLRGVVASNCTVALPWANADLNAVGRTGDPWLMREAIERGQYTIHDVLGVWPTSRVIIPPAGYIDPTAAANLRWLAPLNAPEGTDPLGAAWEAQQSSDVSREALPLRTLVADNTVGETTSANAAEDHPADAHVLALTEELQAVTYDSALASTLATLGSNPETTAFSNPQERFDYSLDSPVARRQLAANALFLAVDRAADAGRPLLVLPPTSLEADDAQQLLNGLHQATRRVPAVPFAEAISAPEHAAIPRAEMTVPFSDPGAFGDTEIQPVAQQATTLDNLSQLLSNEPSIALQRYVFTAPLRRDILTALSATQRRSELSFDNAVLATRQRTGALRDTIRSLRTSVALIPPGNVVTRASENSPLLIVARNGLPLPVHATISDSLGTATNTTLDIPARGSITVEFTPNLPPSGDSELSLWLATQEGARVSDPVELSVQTRARAITTWAVLAMVSVILGLALLFRAGRARRQRHHHEA